MASAIKVKTDHMKELKRLHKLSETELAKRIGVSTQTLRRAMEGENVSSAFIAGTCLYFRTPFETLFQAITTEQPIAA